MSDLIKSYVWIKADRLLGLAEDWRLDPAGELIWWHAYGDRNSSVGWELGHIVPRSEGGSDHFFNMQAEHWRTNLKKEEARRGQMPLQSWGLAAALSVQPQFGGLTNGSDDRPVWGLGTGLEPGTFFPGLTATTDNRPGWGLRAALAPEPRFAGLRLSDDDQPGGLKAK